MADPNGTRHSGLPESGNLPSQSKPILNESLASLSVSLSRDIETLASELRARWALGQRVPAEALADGTFGKTFAVVSANDEHLLDLLYHEILIRQEFDEQPSAMEFCQRFPRLRERIERLFAVHMALEEEPWDERAWSDLPEASDSSESQPHESSGPTSADSSDSQQDSDEERTPQWPRRRSARFAVEPPPGYELLDEVGRGGMAVVYRARQQILNRMVALKMLLGGGMASPEVLARIRQEARAVAQLQHPGIVQIYEVGEHQGLPYLSLEFVAGGTLHQWLKGQPLPPLEACRIVEQLALITQFAHERGIVHRDLKPANILLTERPDSSLTPQTESLDSSRSAISSTMSLSVKISDFGLARVLGHQSDLTATGQVIGTPSYMSPEQAAGTGEDAAPAQDVYSLGAILFELLTGRPPFRGATLFDTLEQVRTDEPVPPRRLQPRVPADLETVCLKCLQKNPAKRYSSAQDLANDLRAIQRGEPIQARPAKVSERLWKLIRRHPAEATLMMLTILAIVAGVTGVMTENHRANQREVEANRQRDRALQLSDALLRERDEAQRQRQSAEQQRILAEAARSEAVIARQQAELSLDQSLTAINSLANFGMELRHSPQQQPTSRRILDETLKLYDQLEKSHGSSTRLRRPLAFTLVRAGEIRSVLRETSKARELLQRGAELLNEELKQSPDDPQLHRYLTYTHWVHGNLLKDIGIPTEALASYRKSLEAGDAELRLQPDSVKLLRGKANVLTNICVVLIGQGKVEEALSTFDQAIALLRDLQSRNPTDYATQSELALVLHDYSAVLNRLGQVQPAAEAFNEAMSIRQELFARSPLNYENRTLFSRLYISRGQALMRSRQPAEALKEFSEAAELLRPAADAFPTVFEYQNALIGTLAAQLDAQFALGDANGVNLVWDQLTEKLLSGRDNFKEDRQFVVLMQLWLPDRCDHLVEQGRNAEAGRIMSGLLEASVWLAAPTTAELDPKPSKVTRAGWLNNVAWYLTVSPVASEQNPAQAVELARESLALHPDQPNYLHTLATALYESGDFETAREYAQKAFDAASSNTPFERLDPLVPVLLAMAQWQVGEHEQARTLLARVPEPSSKLTRSGPQVRRFLSEARKLIQPEPKSEAAPLAP
jgi:serine/threonine protein kinase/Flp pilus assembly protein TadD